jgi:hypothetical protein
MEILKGFSKVNRPNGDEASPRKADLPTPQLGGFKNLQ